MELKVLDSNPGKLRVEVLGESHTLLNIITEYAWKTNPKQVSYVIEHPYLSQPELIVRSKNPKKTLSDASQLVIDATKDFSAAFKRASKK